MSPQVAQLIIFGVEEAIAQFPALLSDFQAIFATGTPTAADFAALRAKVASENYGQFVPDSALNASAAPSSAQVSPGTVL